MAGRFADGAWLAELAPVRDPALVPAVVAAALGVREQPGVPAAGALARVLARQQLLLVLDNCEHVAGAAAQLCAGLLAACDEVRVLASSREPLAVAGEARYRLGPLGLPGLDDLADLARCESVALFTDRARRADAGFALDEGAGPVVARLVARLDGLPLAIELAAARVEALGVPQLLDRIDDRFALLTAGDRGAADRQRSLAATVDWSYRLLDERERRVFRAVSVFPAGFTLEAAEAVAGPCAGPAVLRLVDCSLLSPPRAGPDGRRRYVTLETLRAYGAGLLAETGEQDQAAAALAGYALRVAGQAAAGSQSPGGELAAARCLDAEDATMRQALGWAVEHDTALALRLAGALGWWWFVRGRLAGEYRLVCRAAGRARGGQRRVARRADLARLGSAVLGRSGHSARPFHRGTGRRLWPAAVPGAGLRPGRPVISLAAHGPDRRGGRRCRPRAGPGPGDRGPGRRAAGPDRAQSRRRLCRRSRRGGAAGPAGRAQITAGIPGGLARLCSYVLTIVLADAGNLAEAARAGTAAWPGPGTRATCRTRRTCCPGSRTWTCGRAGPATPRRTCGKGSTSRCGPAPGLSCSPACPSAGTYAPPPGAPPRPSRYRPRAPRLAGTRN